MRIWMCENLITSWISLLPEKHDAGFAYAATQGPSPPERRRVLPWSRCQHFLAGYFRTTLQHKVDGDRECVSTWGIQLRRKRFFLFCDDRTLYFNWRAGPDWTCKSSNELDQ